jgi:hypothetical protein
VAKQHIGSGGSPPSLGYALPSLVMQVTALVISDNALSRHRHTYRVRTQICTRSATFSRSLYVIYILHSCYIINRTSHLCSWWGAGTVLGSRWHSSKGHRGAGSGSMAKGYRNYEQCERVRSYLHEMKKAPTPLCSCPEKVEQTARHLMTECSLFSKDRPAVLQTLPLPLIMQFHIHTVDVYRLTKNIFQMLQEQSKRDQFL